MTKSPYIRRIKCLGAALVGFAWVVTGLCESPAFGQIDDLRVAVAPASGPKRARLRSFQRGLVKGLRATGLRVVTPKRLARAARRRGVGPDNVVAAEAMRADLLLITQIERRRRRYNVSVQVVDVATDRERETFTVSYRRRKKSFVTARRMGRKIGEQLILEATSPREEEPDRTAAVIRPSAPEHEGASEEVARGEPDIGASQEREPFSRGGAESEAGFSEPATGFSESETGFSDSDVEIAALNSERFENSELEAGVESRRSRPAGEARGREDAIFRMGAFAGTQMATNYSVEVGGQSTGLSYDLGLLFLVGADLSIRLPVGLGFEAALSYAPVSYELDVMPALPVQEPGGRFLGVGGGVSWAFVLSRFGNEGGFWMAPLLAIDYASMSAESQGPDSVVVSWSSIDAHAGVRFTLRATCNLAIDVEGHVGRILSFSEDPSNTGEDGSGLSLRFGSQLRYWLFDGFSLSVRAGFHRQNVNLSGAGTRAGFLGDPALIDATISASDLKLGAGVQLAF